MNLSFLRNSNVRSGTVFSATILIFALFLLGSPANAQRYTVKYPKDRQGKRSTSKKVSRTSIEVIVLSQRGAGLQAQQWSRVFQKLGVSLRVRKGRLNDTIGVTQQIVGTFRRVTLTGQLTARGTLDFAERSFSRRDSGNLKKWIDELKKFGAQGSPEGKALWGLKKKQFERVFNTLKKPLKNDVKGKKLKEAIAAMNFPREFKPKFSPQTNRMLNSLAPDRLVIGREFRDLSNGTSLAILLKKRGLGFYPLRHAEGSVEIVIEPLVKSKKFWPIGWELSRFKMSRQKTAPKLFELIPVSLEDVPFQGTLDAVEKKIEIPIFVDRYAISLAEIDLENASVSYQKSRTTWNLLIKAISSKHKLTSRLKVDEAGKPFVWITPFTPRRIRN